MKKNIMIMFIILIVVVIVAFLFVCFSSKPELEPEPEPEPVTTPKPETSPESDPTEVLKWTMDIELPESAKIQNYSYYDSRNDDFLVKISFDAEDYEYIKQQLDHFFIVNHYDDKTGADLSFCPWWNLEKNEIVDGYFMHTPDTPDAIRTSLAYITRDSDGEYYLYIYTVLN